MTQSKIYPELTGFRHRGEDCPSVVFPEKCPCCGAEKVEENTFDQFWAKCEYACGGVYKSKVQIQSHTYIWHGCCGLES